MVKGNQRRRQRRRQKRLLSSSSSVPTLHRCSGSPNNISQPEEVEERACAGRAPPREFHHCCREPFLEDSRFRRLDSPGCIRCEPPEEEDYEEEEEEEEEEEDQEPDDATKRSQLSVPSLRELSPGSHSQIEVKIPSQAGSLSQSREEMASRRPANFKTINYACNFYGLANDRQAGGPAGSAKEQPVGAKQRGLGVPPALQSCPNGPPRPVIFVEPRNDDSYQCDCSNCHFLSGWCCFPVGLILLMVVLIVWYWMVNSRKQGVETESMDPKITSYLPID